MEWRDKLERDYVRPDATNEARWRKHQVQGDSGPEHPKLSTLIGHFVGHVCLGAVGFLALAIPAILFSLAAHYLQEIPVSALVIDVFIGIHYSLLIVDTLMFAAYILVSVYGAAKALIRYLKGL